MVRHAEATDLDAITGLYEASRRFMRENGNPTQWANGFPPRELLEEDIRVGRLYVCCDENGVYGAFALIFGDDPTYAEIDGAWRDSSPYATIHRVSGGRGRGVFGECIAYARGQIDHLRIDTHSDNAPMQHLITKAGFVRCGIIHISDGTPRIAYEWTK